MKKMLVGLVLAVGALVGFGGSAQASSYPPGDPGTVSFGKPDCNLEWIDDTTARLASWSMSIGYKVSEATKLTVAVGSDQTVVLTQDLPIGSGSIPFGSDTPGVPEGHLAFPVYATLSVDGLDTTTAQTYPCLPVTGDDGSEIASVGSTASQSGTKAGTRSASSSTQQLPSTGLNTTLIALAALALVTNGIALIALARRPETL